MPSIIERFVAKTRFLATKILQKTIISASFGCLVNSQSRKVNRLAGILP